METPAHTLEEQETAEKHISIKDCLRLIGIKELAANIFVVPVRKQEVKKSGKVAQ